MYDLECGTSGCGVRCCRGDEELAIAEEELVRPCPENRVSGEAVRRGVDPREVSEATRGLALADIASRCVLSIDPEAGVALGCLVDDGDATFQGLLDAAASSQAVLLSCAP